MESVKPAALQRWLRAQGDAAPAWTGPTLAELDELLGTTLAHATWSSASPAGFVRSVGQALDELRGPARDLARFLTPTPAAGGASLVAAVAEILFVPRHDRSEYLDNRLASPPWDVRRLLIEYAVWARRVDRAATSLTRDYCATRCHRLPMGCCTIPGYDMGVTTEAMLAAQELEARLSGWRPPRPERDCRYHGPTGCALLRFKSPACAGMLCEPLVASLQRRFGAPEIDPFLRSLAHFRNQTLDRAAIFDAMRRVVSTARRLHERATRLSAHGSDTAPRRS